MSGPRLLSSAAGTENIVGQTAAQRFIERAGREFLDPDDLLRSVLLAQAGGPERLRGLCRAIQKILEAGQR